MQGLVLTDSASPSATLGAIRSNDIPLLKVITQWGAPWTAPAISQVTVTMPELIVRTVNGDGCAPPPPGQSIIFLDPAIVLAELTPWLTARPSLWIELGNEPNNYDASDDAAWVFRYWFIETVRMLRSHFPAARIISPGLIENRQADWWAICCDAFSLADAIGFHAYAWHDFTPGDTGQIERALDQLRGMFAARPWVLTECGINDAGTAAETKAQRYSALHAKLPSQVLGCCWYHICDRPSNPDQQAYALPSAAWPSLSAGGTL